MWMRCLLFFLCLCVLGPLGPLWMAGCEGGTGPTDAGVPEKQHVPPTGELVINEIAAKGEPDDWFEVYNASDKTIDLSQYTFTDNIDKRTNAAAFPEGTTLEPGAYKAFFLTDEWPGFRLGSDEELGIFDAKGRLVDSVDWNEGDSPAGESFGRFPDRSGPFRRFVSPTPGLPNVE